VSNQTYLVRYSVSNTGLYEYTESIHVVVNTLCVNSSIRQTTIYEYREVASLAEGVTSIGLNAEGVGNSTVSGVVVAVSQSNSYREVLVEVITNLRGDGENIV
jgi:hypothetical protein